MLGAIPQAFKPQNIQKGFEKFGIWPFNSNIFSDEDFLCSSVTDRDFPNTDRDSLTQNDPMNKKSPTLVLSEQPMRLDQSKVGLADSNNLAIAGPSQPMSRDQISEVTEAVTPETVRPYPKAGPRKPTGMNRKRGKTRILTDTPEKKLIEIAEQEKQRKLYAKIQKTKIPKLPQEFTSNRLKRRKISSSESEIENVSFADSSEFSFVEETSEEERDEDDVILLDRKFKVNDFVLVKFHTKKTVVHYVGRIMEISVSTATIKFMRLSKIQNTFRYPEVDDIAGVPIEDIKPKLPEPKTCIAGKRGCSKYTFTTPLWVIPNLR